MAKVVSIVPTSKCTNTNAHAAQGTKVLLDDGSRLEHVHKVTLVAEKGAAWKAIIEVYPTNQQQIDAIIEDLKVVSSETTDT
ncbi:hypothetical protein [Acinetobacter sp. MB5]|uniref:hypothetical protein n=1 Tax=Acinetobacter sp. MB5 TaxID=2069438 RepID=UPI000DD0A441|nr:hypothetical protein [Acinetobacter sp. MB5]